MRVAVLGGGAAGVFAAISCKRHHPDAQVTLYEKTDRLLQKVKISGGGRCNVTHACFSIPDLVKQYPRGAKPLKKAFRSFTTTDTVEWFESRGVKLKTEADGRMFPVTDSSQTIIDCLESELAQLRIRIDYNSRVVELQAEEGRWELHFPKGSITVDNVIVATGGSPNPKGLAWLQELGHAIESPVPSLFTFNLPKDPIRELMGVVADLAEVRIQGTDLRAKGSLLITHWGMSGPAVLKLSAFGARLLHERRYTYTVQVNWLGGQPEHEVRAALQDEWSLVAKRQVKNRNPFGLPNRLWEFLVQKAGLPGEVAWEALAKKERNRLINTLLNDTYEARGKTTFKEEFVTCGGISWRDVAVPSMQSKVAPGLYFAGEVLDGDGVTGGFNFQAAWTTGFLAGQLQ